MQQPDASLNLEGLAFPEAYLRAANLEGANLKGAVLSSVDLRDCNLKDANLRFSDLDNSYLVGADLSGTDLCNANLFQTSFTEANLTGAQLALAHLFESGLYRANLTLADLTGANMTNADLSGAYLESADFDGTDLAGANFSSAKFLNTTLRSVDLSRTENLHKAQHIEPSSVDAFTLEQTARGLRILEDPSRRQEVEQFLRGSGIPEVILNSFSAMIESPIDFYSAFISYSHADKRFARRLFSDLQSSGVRCWLDEHELLPGDPVGDSIDRGIRLWDKVLLCCSFQSLTSWWVRDEIDKALEKERKLLKDRGEKTLAIIPINLDGSLFDWEDGNASTLRKRLAADFTGWDKDNAKYEAQLERVVKALRADDFARPAPPTPKL
ncbi:MAG: toll/interleukin-1 receptor domain-containing protein [Acidobacteriota bacterium]